MTTSTAFIDLRINNAEQLKESVSEPSPNTVLYLVYGKTNAWANDSSPNVANSSMSTYYEVWHNMIGGKRLFGGDLYHVIPRYDWVSGNTYTAYDHMSSSLFDGNTQFYAVNSDYSVYKCLANNKGQPSTVEPTSVNPEIASTTSDGYIWKYMYTISDSEQIRYTTDNYIPVKTLSINDGSLQWQVQDSAVDGSIETIFVTNGGSNYTDANTITVSISGDGSGATAIATRNTTTNNVESVILTDSGTGYTYASVTITSSANGTGAQARAIISPPGGHGKNPLYELGGKNIMINTRLRYDEEGTIVAENDFRQISILKDPYLFNSANVARLSTVNQTQVLTMAGVGDYINDEFVYQGTSLATSTYSGRVAKWDSATNSLYLLNIRGTPTTSQALTGANSFTNRVLSGLENQDLKKHTGQILYVDNIVPVTRSMDQIEDFKLVVKF